MAELIHESEHRALQLEEHAQRQLASPAPPPRGAAHGAKTTSLT